MITTIKKISFFGLFFLVNTILAQSSQYKFSGYIRDAKNGEDLIGATVYVKEIENGTTTNIYGFYSLTLPKGVYNIVIQYVGYSKQEFQLTLDNNIQKNIELSNEKFLEEIIVREEKEDQNLLELNTGTNQLSIQTLKSLPALLGEVDVIRGLTLLPGVTTVGEGATGFNVRGGRIGENLILLDDAPVYNSAHLLGFFSIFNPDAVKDVKLYKAGIPARYGGRASSVLDVRMKEGNNKALNVKGGIGTVFSRFSVEAPIVEDKASFILAGRRSYIDILLAPFLNNNLSDLKINYYDLTAKVNYAPSDKNRLFISSYFGRDINSVPNAFKATWGNQTATFRWNHIFNNNLFSNLVFYYSNFTYELGFGSGENTFDWNADIINYGSKFTFDYYLSTKTLFNFGVESIYYIFKPGSTSAVNAGENSVSMLPRQYALESGIYFSSEQKITNTIDLSYGLRYSLYNYLGAGTVYEYKDTEDGVRDSLVSTGQASRGQSIAFYKNFEPRILLNFRLNLRSSIKLSYDRTAQYIHLLSNTAASTPLDIWRSSTNNIEPEIVDQYSIGYFYNFSNNSIQTSVQIYNKEFKNVVEYINGASLLLNTLIEADLFSVKGRAYGLELLVEKKKGKWQGWLAYTLSRTELKTPAFNQNNWYPTRYDQTHNLTIVSFYDINDRIRLSGTFTYISGTPTTIPTNRVQIQGFTLPYSPENVRNNYRIEPYHRLDFGVEVHRKKLNRKGVKPKNDGFWVLSLYNIYLRKNPYSVYLNNTDQGLAKENLTATKLSILATIIPSISYNFNF